MFLSWFGTILADLATKKHRNYESKLTHKTAHSVQIENEQKKDIIYFCSKIPCVYYASISYIIIHFREAKVKMNNIAYTVHLLLKLQAWTQNYPYAFVHNFYRISRCSGTIVVLYLLL